MNVFLYLHPLELDVLRHAQLHLRAVRDSADPYQNNAPMVEHRAARISDQEFERALQRQFKALPADLKGLVDWETFRREAAKNRDKIEAKLRKGPTVSRPALPEARAYDGLGWCRLFARADNPLLWERYAAQHGGVVLELESACLGFAGGQRQLLRRVVYGQRRPQADHPMKPFPALFHRPPEFAAEEEIRLIRPLAEAKASKPLSSGRQIYLYPFPPQALMSVTLGVRASAQTRKQVRHILNYDTRYKPGRPLREVLLEPDSFRLHIRDS